MMTWECYQGDPVGWDALIESLNGGFYQSFGWGEVRRAAGWEPVRILARDDDVVAAAASVLVKRKLGAAICWVPGGPAGRLAGLDGSFRKALAACVGSRILYCRISVLRADAGEEANFLSRLGWKRPAANMSSGLIMMYPLAGDEDERLKRMSGNWRHNFKRSGRYDLRIDHWETPDLDQVSALYREMESLKSLPVQHSAEELEAMFRHLGGRIAMYRCRDAENNLLAVRAAGLIGDTAMDLLAVAGEAARKLYASHATLWALLNHCHRLGLRDYDLSGVDPEGNKGVYTFKLGVGSALVKCLGEWEWAAVPGMRRAVNWQIGRRGPS